MTDDLVQRLQSQTYTCADKQCGKVRKEAAERIEMLGCGRDKWEINASQDRIVELLERSIELRERIKTLEAALQEIAEDGIEGDFAGEIARRALEGK